MAASTLVTALVLAAGGVLAVALVAAAFYAVGRSEDRERDRRRPGDR
jgi:4-hydroxybenzoate polyprenyltransferase